jgi:predicted transcriptional regulator
LSPILTTLEIADLVEPIVFFDASDPVSHLIGNLKESKSYEVFVEDKSRTASVSFRELLNVENIASTKLASIVLPVPRIEVTDSILYIARLMFEHKIRALPVYKNEKVLGKITSRSIIKSILESTRNSKVSLVEIMTPDPICIKTSDSVAKARSMMLRKKNRSITHPRRFRKAKWSHNF